MSFWNQDRENSRQTFTIVWSFQILVFFFEKSCLSCIVVHSLSNGCLQTRLVGSSIFGADIINEGQDIIWVAIIVLHSHFYLETIWFATKVENRCQSFLIFVQVLYEILDTIFIMKGHMVVFFLAEVGQRQRHVLQQEGWFFDPLSNGVKFEIRRWKDGWIRHEGDLGPCLRLRSCSYLLKSGNWFPTIFKALLVDRSITGNLNLKPTRKGIDDRRSHSMETTRGLIPPLTKLPSGVEDRKNHFNGWFAHSMHPSRHSTSLVFYR